MNKPKILLVTTDTEFRREILTALGNAFAFTWIDNGEEALTRLARERGFEVALSGIKLPGIDGLEFLSRVREQHPTVACIIATVDGDYETALKAINGNGVFRFLTKPCNPEDLKASIEAGVRKHRLDEQENNLWKETMNGCVKMLVEILELSYPEAIARSTRIKHRVRLLGRKMEVKPYWLLELVASLSHIGCMGMPKAILAKLEKGIELSKEESRTFSMHPVIAAQLLRNIPRMDKVAEIIRHQSTPCRLNPPMASRLLRVCLEIDYLDRKGVAACDAVKLLRQHPDTYDATVVEALDKHTMPCMGASGIKVSVGDLEPGMVMSEDLVTEGGAKLLLKGQTLSEASQMRLQAFADLLGVVEPVHVVPPQARADA